MKYTLCMTKQPKLLALSKVAIFRMEEGKVNFSKFERGTKVEQNEVSFYLHVVKTLWKITSKTQNQIFYNYINWNENFIVVTYI